MYLLIIKSVLVCLITITSLRFIVSIVDYYKGVEDIHTAHLWILAVLVAVFYTLHNI